MRRGGEGGVFLRLLGGKWGGEWGCLCMALPLVEAGPLGGGGSEVVGPCLVTCWKMESMVSATSESSCRIRLLLPLLLLLLLLVLMLPLLLPLILLLSCCWHSVKTAEAI